MKIHRRQFLKAAAIGAAAAPLLLRARRAEALEPVPSGLWATSPSGGHGGPVQRVFEIFLNGGICAFDTFLVEPGTATACASLPSCPPGVGDREAFFGTTANKWGTYACGFQRMYEDERPSRAGTPLTAPFAGGYHFGPALWPLWPHMDRMRVMTMRHDVGAHAPALQLMLSGFSPGSPRAFATGAAVNAFYSGARAPNVTVSGRSVRLPAAYSITHNSVSGYDAVFASGQLGAQHRPLGITTGSCTRFPSSSLFPTRTPVDPDEANLMRFYQQDYESRLHTSLGTRLRSRAFGEYEAAVGDYLRWDDISSALGRYDPASFPLGAALQPSETCTPRRLGNDCERDSYVSQVDGSSSSLHLGAFLLRECGARYVNALVGTLDTHYDHVRSSYRQLSHIFQTVAQMLASGAIPSDTLIVITTEFGRTPGAQEPNGREHFPEGYATVLLRPQLGSSASFAGRTVLGSVTESGAADARTAVTPAQLRSALLVMLGINPIGADAFNEGSVRGGVVNGASSIELCQSLKNDLIGASRS